ncbi:MAG TPA: hypothetical protein VGK30_05100 [Candidatus Binatia bacterium]
MMAVAARLARAVNRLAQRDGRVLADRYHVRLLRTPIEVRGALRYVLLNARHHLTRKPAGVEVNLDPASSARWFDGWKRGLSTGIGNEEPSGQRPVVRARTWLLTIGWRRYGLLDPADVPGKRRRKSGATA